MVAIMKRKAVVVRGQQFTPEEGQGMGGFEEAPSDICERESGTELNGLTHLVSREHPTGARAL